MYQTTHDFDGAAVRVTREGLVRHLDIVLVVLATIPVIALGAPAFGYAMGAGGWIVQRVIQANEDRWTLRLTEPRQRLTAHLAQAFGRIWLLAAAIVIAGVLGHRAAGLTAAITIFVAYSVAFGIKVVTGPPTSAGRRGGNAR